MGKLRKEAQLAYSVYFKQHYNITDTSSEGTSLVCSCSSDQLHRNGLFMLEAEALRVVERPPKASSPLRHSDLGFK